MHLPKDVTIKCRVTTANGDITGILLLIYPTSSGAFGTIMNNDGELKEYPIHSIKIDNPIDLINMNHTNDQ